MDSSNSEVHSNPGDWATKSAPFFRIPEEGWNRIEASLRSATCARAKLLYAALCRVANRERSATFVKPLEYIATLASISKRTVERALPELERLGLVTVERRALRQPHRYTMATLSRNATTESRNDATTTTAVNGLYGAPPKEDQKEERSAPLSRDEPLSTAERISLERAKEILAEQIERLKNRTHYPHDRIEHPEFVRELQEKQSQLMEIENRMVTSCL